VIFSGVADMLDGRIARARQLASARGAFMDSALDRFGETFSLAGVVVYLSGRPLAVTAGALALGGSMLVSYVRARGEALGITYHGGLMQRAERLVLLALAALADPAMTRWANWTPGVILAWTVGMIAVGSLATAAHRTFVIARALRAPRWPPRDSHFPPV
jgi:CDP-diacylglycerol--glycerol-3-phosphate 3-phosphatidyltransferase